MLYLSVSGSMSEYFKNGFSISYSSMVSLVLIPIDFQNQTYWELVFTELDPGVGVPDVGGTVSSLLQRKFHYFGIPSQLGYTTLGVAT